MQDLIIIPSITIVDNINGKLSFTIKIKKHEKV